ncbi:MAG: DUF2842 domain-containing protein [Pseudomonadota bacterium]
MTRGPDGDDGSEMDPELYERGRRRRLLLLTLVLLLGLPLYLIAASTVLGALTAPTAGADGGIEKPLHWSVELMIYLGLGLIWVFPLKGLTKGLGRNADGSRK